MQRQQRGDVQHALGERFRVSARPRPELAVILSALADLPGKQRLVFEARYIEELPPGAIAEQHGMSVGAVYTNLSRARNSIAARLVAAGFVVPEDERPTRPRRAAE